MITQPALTLINTFALYKMYINLLHNYQPADIAVGAVVDVLMCSIIM
jgi:hypothetical protein